MPNAAARARRLSERGRVERGLAEMVGLVRGVIADGVISGQEAEHLAEWTRENPEVASRWPANILARRLERILLDGRVDSRERGHLAAILEQLAENPGGLSAGFPLATDLPLTHPPPEIEFEDRTFLFAGEFAFGPTHACEREIQERGGSCERTVNRRTDYIVIGSIAAADWCQSEFAEVIDEVVQYRARGVPIAVVSEEWWTGALV
jgi:hypothetical protein